MPKGYTTKSKVEQALNTTITSDIDSWINSAEKFIDSQTDRNFIATREVKKYDGNNECKIFIDDFINIENLYFVVNNSTGDANTETLNTTDYFVYNFDDPNKKPFNKIVLNANSSFNYFLLGQQNIWVDALFGYSETVPADIEMVATKLVASVYSTSQNGSKGEIRSFTQGELSVSYGGFQSVLEKDIGLQITLQNYKREETIKSFTLERA